MAGTIVYVFISFLVSSIFVILGISQIHSSEPVGINTGEKPPKPEELISVKEWNQKHGRNFIIYGCLLFLTMILFWILFSVLELFKLSFVFLAVAVVGEFLFLELGHIYLKKKFIIKSSTIC